MGSARGGRPSGALGSAHGGFFEILLANIGGRILLGMLRAWDVRAYWLVVGALLAGLIVYLVWHKVRFETWFKAAPAEKQPSRAA